MAECSCAASAVPRQLQRRWRRIDPIESCSIGAGPQLIMRGSPLALHPTTAVRSSSHTLPPETLIYNPHTQLSTRIAAMCIAAASASLASSRRASASAASAVASASSNGGSSSFRRKASVPLR